MECPWTSPLALELKSVTNHILQPKYPSCVSFYLYSFNIKAIICGKHCYFYLTKKNKAEAREAPWLVQGHTANKWWKWNLSSGLLDSKIYAPNQMSKLHHKHQPIFLDALLILEWYASILSAISVCFRCCSRGNKIIYS